MKRPAKISALLLISAWVLSCRAPDVVKVGSKEFTESVILGEIATRLARTRHAKVTHMKALGGTRVLWDALVKGDIDLYPEYTGTLGQEILANKQADGDLAQSLATYGIRMSNSIGFDDSYALGMKESTAEHWNIKTISDLKKHPKIRLGFSNEFMDRRDGWSGLRSFYQLPQKNVTGLEHQLAYRALNTGAIDVTDLYSTDADIVYYHLRVLEDDRHFFPPYTAVMLYRADLARRAPDVLRAVLRLQGAVSRSEMVSMNAQVKLQGATSEKAAAEFVARHFSLQSGFEDDSLLRRLLLRGREHIYLVSISLLSAILISIPLGIAAFLHERLGQIILGIVGLIQTIPSLALIVFMIPLLGIGNVPALVALFLYSLLPIVRSTHAGLKDIPVPVRESAAALGLPRLACIRLVELPIASRSILSGIKTSAVINVGTATLGALIGAGGFGQPILTGIRLNNLSLILEGAVPAAGLALLVQGLFDLLESFFVPKGLRIEPQQ
jgi:osmoprotectant transport system permease protein